MGSVVRDWGISKCNWIRFQAVLKIRDVSSDERLVDLSARRRDSHKWMVFRVECGMVCRTPFLVFVSGSEFVGNFRLFFLPPSFLIIMS